MPENNPAQAIGAPAASESRATKLAFDEAELRIAKEKFILERAQQISVPEQHKPNGATLRKVLSLLASAIATGGLIVSGYLGCSSAAADGDGTTSRVESCKAILTEALEQVVRTELER